MFWIGTSWKMNKTQADARAFFDALSRFDLPAAPEAQLFVIPPFTAIETAMRAAANMPILIGAQNVGPAEEGAFTGEVSAAMLAEIGCDLVEIGHSERRQYFGETDETVNAKVRLVLGQGMRPLVCVGETAEQRASGAAQDIVLGQTRIAFRDVAETQLAQCLIAYEPVWAIGDGGTPAQPDDAAEVHALLKAEFPACPVLYGGSVTADNCAGFAQRPEIDGLFIGRAAWAAEGFQTIIARSLAALTA